MLVSVPQPKPRRTPDAHNRPRPPTLAPRAQDFRLIEARARVRELARHGNRHRLTWFETLQGLSFLAFVMLARNTLVSGLLICGGIAMCVPALIATGVRGRVRKPMHLVLATFWALIGTSYFLLI